jgi:hypothetical protein
VFFPSSSSFSVSVILFILWYGIRASRLTPLQILSFSSYFFFPNSPTKDSREGLSSEKNKEREEREEERERTGLWRRFLLFWICVFADFVRDGRKKGGKKI